MGQKGSKVLITGTDRAVLQLKRSKDEIHKFTRRTDQLIKDERECLKQMIRDDPKNYKKDVRVRFLLKRIHYQENLVQKASDQLINLENMVSTIEFKLVEKQFIDGLKSSNEVLKKLNREFGDVDKLLDDVQDQVSYQNEIDNILSNSIIGVNDYEEEIDKELDAMEQSTNSINENNMPSTRGLPHLNLEEEEDIQQEEVQKQQVSSKVPMLAS